MRSLLTLTMAACGAAVAATASRQPAPATLILYGGPIYTASDDHPTVDAVAVRGDRIVRIGAEADVLLLRGQETEVVDLKGATVVPGLHDAHGHFARLGQTLSELDLRDSRSVEEIAARVRAQAAETPPGEWIEGRAWDQNDWPVKRWPDREDLDRVAPDHPVYLTRVDGHAAWANSRALALAGVSRETPDPPGGRVLRDAAGEPTGVLIDTAQALVRSKIPSPDPATRERHILAADRECRRLGLTMVHDAGVPASTLEIYRRLVAEGRLATRLYVMLANEAATTTAWFERGPLIDPAHQLTVRAVKLVADGALGSRGAALLEPYADEPGNRGLLVTPPDRLERTARAATAAGFQVCTHAIGDRANRLVLDLYERLEREQPGMRLLRPRIEHAQILDAADIPRFARLGVIASMQPTHCTSDMPWVPDRLGAARTDEGAYAWQTLLQAGVVVSGSDFPVERPDPMRGFYAAITRQTPEGQPPGGWAPDQRMTRQQALRSFTRDAAFAAHAEADLGMIAPGRLADFVVLSRDIMRAPARDVLTTTVRRTIIAGRTVYEAPEP